MSFETFLAGACKHLHCGEAASGWAIHGRVVFLGCLASLLGGLPKQGKGCFPGKILATLLWCILLKRACIVDLAVWISHS